MASTMNAPVVISTNFGPNVQNVAVPAPLAGIPDLPAEFPVNIDSPLAWTGTQYADQAGYITVLSKDDVQEAEKALLHFKGVLPSST